MKRAGESYRRAADSLDGERYDVIVIGSGIGGLTTAALLGRFAGQRVLVLEQHYVAGGFCHSFARPGYDWDVGIHYVGDMATPGHPSRRMFDLVTDGAVEWAPMGDVYDRVIVGDEVYDYRTGLREWKAQMVEYFPDQADAIDAYVTAVKEVSGTVRAYAAEKALPDPVAAVAGSRLRKPFLRHAARTTREVLEGLTDDERLITVLTAQHGDYGLPPRRSSFAMHAMVTNHYFRGGAYPVGGASEIPAAAEAVINAHGGRVFVKAPVEEILVRDGRAHGVRMADGREIRADQVVSNAGALNTFRRLLPGAVADDIGAPRLLDGVRPSLGHLSLYLGLDISTADMGLAKPNLWIYQGDDHDAHWEAYEADHTAPLPLVYVSFPSAKDPDFERRHPGHSTIDVITLARNDWFSEWDGTRWQRRGEDYEALKSGLEERLIDATAAHVPGLRDHIDVAEMSTPLTTQHFAGYAQGELYGLDHDAGRFAQRWLRPRTPIKGLYLTGQDVLTAGMVGAMMGGAVTASAMAGRDLLKAGLRSALPGSR